MMRALLYTLALPVTCYLLGHTPSTQALQCIDSSFTKALALFRQKKYETAQSYMEEYARLHQGNLQAIEAQYYAAVCAIKLNRPDGTERLHQFVKTYPYHRKAALAYYELGNTYWTNQDYAQSITYYLAVDTSQLAIPIKHELQYRLGYALLNENNLDQALIYFDDVKEFDNPYTYTASYYAGYIKLRYGDYEAALADLKKAGSQESYQSVIPYLILEAYYQQQRFTELIAYSNEITNQSIYLKNQEDITLLTAEAYFLLQDYTKAAYHYENYMAYPNVIVTGEILYRLAYALYKIGEDYKALQYFKEAALQEDSISSLASYYVGLLYLKTDQKNWALTALDQARKTNGPREIHEEAAFQYAKVNYDIGNWTESIETLQNFKQTYPESDHISEANSLLSEAYLHTNNYGLAIEHIKGLSDKPAAMLKVYQQVTLYQGANCFNNEAYDQALSWLEESLQHAYDKELTTQAYFWLGETLSAQQAYPLAITPYQEVLKRDPQCRQALYGLAHAYFNTGDYHQALSNFNQYISQTDQKTPWVTDAIIRLADCYYATKDYQQALQLYDRAIAEHPEHAYYQKALIYGILTDMQAAQTSLAVILKQYAHTAYYEKALFENARLSLLQNDYAEAIQGFTKFMLDKPHSPLVPDALLNRAIAYENLQQYAQASRDYETILEEYPTYSDAQSALLGLSKLTPYEKEADKLKNYLAKYQAANPNSHSLEELNFETSKALFYNQRYNQAIEHLHNFVMQYPESPLVHKAYFLIAETYYRLDDNKQALSYYQLAMHNKQTPFYNKILLRIASIAYKQQEFTTALKHYEELKVYASNKKETYHALEGIMKTNHALQKYGEVVQAAALIMEQGNITVNATQQAKLYLGKVAMQQGQRQQAIDYFKQVIANSKDSHAAEAQYLLAMLYHQAGDYEASLETLFELNKQFSNYQAWTGEAFLLIADNYNALNELFQAKATLQSIIEHATDQVIVAKAQQKLAVLVQQAELAQEQEEGENSEFKILTP